MAALLRVDALQAGYGSGTVLHDVSLEVGRGEVVAVVGSNGAGKTTLLRAISGLLPCRSGSVHLEDRRIDGMAAHRVARLGLAHAPEGRRLFWPMSVRDNLLLGAYGRGRSRRRGVDADLDRVFTLFPVLGERIHLPAGALSGGQQQMLVIGRALMGDPKVLLLDEPSMGLSPAAVDASLKGVEAVTQHGLGVLLVEQVLTVALRRSARAYVMRRGRVVLAGESTALLDDQERLTAAYLGTESHVTAPAFR